MRSLYSLSADLIKHDIWSSTNDVAKVNVSGLREGNLVESQLCVIGKGQALHPVAIHTFPWCLLHKYASPVINLLGYSIGIPL